MWHMWVNVGPCGLLFVIWYMRVLVSLSLLFGTYTMWVLVGFFVVSPVAHSPVHIKRSYNGAAVFKHENVLFLRSGVAITKH